MPHDPTLDLILLVILVLAFAIVWWPRPVIADEEEMADEESMR